MKIVARATTAHPTTPPVERSSAMTKVKVHFILAFAFCLAGSAEAQDDTTPVDTLVMTRVGGTLAGTSFRCPVSYRSNQPAGAVMLTILMPPFTSVPVPPRPCVRMPMSAGVDDPVSYLMCPIGSLNGTDQKSIVGNIRPPEGFRGTVNCAAFVTSDTPDRTPGNNFMLGTGITITPAQ
jgi:hypothetical protein